VAGPWYRVRTLAHGWLPAVYGNTDYAGWQNSPITALAIQGYRYQVGIAGKTQWGVTYNGQIQWLPIVSGYNISDDNNGYAGMPASQNANGGVNALWGIAFDNAVGLNYKIKCNDGYVAAGCGLGVAQICHGESANRYITEVTFWA